MKNFGGVTGDLCGYFLQVCELVMALVVVVVDIVVKAESSNDEQVDKSVERMKKTSGRKKTAEK